MQVSALKRLKQVLVGELVRVGTVQSIDEERGLVSVELISGGTIVVKGEAPVGKRVLIRGDRVEQVVDIVEYVEFIV